ncbi:uncharacterized protein J4E79_010639 [Alternaria viburni]|uniref:uncharacterized protein n=1 Tax=Alternaria viburni TaxID=566460 RepID=UPI0020C59C45|nr:uncharacterized protein J4E79_010639 [Alternaria viburni]KAI4646130.1 hypothetical protein J4E79_010639 [Alternaria viburni]
MSSVAVEEEALKATILSHIRVIHGEKYPGGSKFDVVSSDTPGDKNQFTAYVVVFPPRPLFKTVENAAPVWSPVMTSSSGISMIQAYEKLLAGLRKEMREVMVKSFTKRRLLRASYVRPNEIDDSLFIQLIYLKAQARAIYGPKYPHGSIFDVIYSSDTTGDGVVSWVIVYPQPNAADWKTGKAVSNDWIPVLKSERIVTGPHSHPVFPTRYLLEKSYNNLIEKLRVQMVETMATMEKTDEAKKLKKYDISTDWWKE